MSDSGLTVSEFAQRAAANVSRELLDVDEITVEDEGNLPDSATPDSKGSQQLDNPVIDKSRVLGHVMQE